MSSKASLASRLLDTDDVRAWDRLAEEHGAVFDSLRWTGLFGKSLRRIGIYGAGDELRGGFCLWEERRLGLRVVRNPPFTRQVGPFFESRATNPSARTTEERAVVEAMAAYFEKTRAAVISLGLSFGIKDCLPFYWRGYKAIPRYTFRIDLTQNEDAILVAFSKVRRNDVRKAGKDGIRIEETTDTRAMDALTRETFARNKKAFPTAATDAIFAGYPPGDNSFCFVARAEARPVAGVYVVHDARTAYYLIGGYADGAHHGAGALAMWHAILKAKELGLEVFDFEGSVIPQIERFFRGFGGELTPIFSVHKAWLPLEIGLKLVKRQLF